jgi:hypothetical protein
MLGLGQDFIEEALTSKTIGKNIAARVAERLEANKERHP